MRRLVRLAHRSGVWALRAGLALGVLALLALVGLRWLLMPWLADYRVELEGYLSERLQRPVSSASLAASWAAGGPALRVEGLRVGDGATALLVRDARARLDLLASLSAGRIVLGGLTLQGLDLPLPGSTPRAGAAALPGWLLAPGAVDIEDGRLLGAEGVIAEFEASARREGDTQRLAATLRPTAPGQGSVRVLAELDVPSRTLSAAHLQGEALRAPDWPGSWSLMPAAVVDFQVWGRFEAGALRGVRGHLDHRAAGARARGDFDLSLGEQGWGGPVQLTLAPADGATLGPWPLRFALRNTPEGAIVGVAGEALDLAAVSAAARAFIPGRSGALEQLAPTGEVHGWQWVARGSPGELDWQFDGELRELGWAPRQGWPGLRGVSGTVSVSGERGELRLHGEAVTVDAPALLRAPRRLALDALATWQTAPGGWRLALQRLALNNADLGVELSGQLRGAAEGVHIDLDGDIRDVDVAQAHAYLPPGWLPESVLGWLDRALVAGRVPRGTLKLAGPLGGFPYRGGEGEFEIRFGVADATLDYHPAWPRIEGLGAEVAFRNQGLVIRATEGRILDAALGPVEVRFDDLRDARLLIAGAAQANAATLREFVELSPLNVSVGPALQGITLRGDTRLDLRIDLPLRGPRAVVGGQLQLLGCEVELEPWGLPLEAVSGVIEFDDHGLRGEGLALRLRGEPARLDLRRTATDGQPRVEAELRGELSAAALLGPLLPALQARMHGAAPWDLRVVQDRAGMALNLVSELRGIAVDLPPPLGKAGPAARPLRLLLDARRDAPMRAELRYGDTTHGVFALRAGDGGYQLDRGQLVIGGENASLPSAPGLEVMARLAELRLPAGAGPPAWSTPAWLSALDARIGDLVVGDDHWSALRVELQRQDDSTRIQLYGPRLAGRLELPHRPEPQRPVRVELQRLHLGPAPADDADSEPPQQELDPRALPALDLDIADLRRGERVLGRLGLAGRPQPDGWRLERLELDAEGLRVRGSGESEQLAERPRSRLQLEVSSAALGTDLARLGYAHGLRGGRAQLALEGSWDGGLSGFALARLDGTLDIDLRNGQLVDVEPGLGRVLGLFSLAALPRRLSLDFSDLFRQGLAFDSMVGRFRLADGNARTDDLAISSPGARIEIRGRVGLAARDYDQQVTVFPHLAPGLPAVGGALVGGPVVGAAVFVAEQLLRGGIEDAVRHRYSISGPWSAPVVAPLPAR